MVRHFSVRAGRAALSVPLAAMVLCGLAGATAWARQCPSGQIFRVSKGICVPKSAASALGVYRGRGAAAVAAPAAGMAVMHSVASTAFASDDVPASDAEKAVDAASRPAAKKPPPLSPFGELDLNSFAKKP